MKTVTIRPITPSDDELMGTIIRKNLEAFGLDIPGTAYFDPEVMHLSDYYHAKPDQRAYFVVVDEADTVLGGGGFAEFPPLEQTAEMQKLYLSDAAKGQGLGTRLVECIESEARNRGYKHLYLETHSVLKAACRLYEKREYTEIESPCANHSAMDRFYIKDFCISQHSSKFSDSK